MAAVACTILISGCAKEEPAPPEGYVEIDTDPEDVDDTVVPEEELHFAEAVPYTGDEQKEDTTVTASESGEDNEKDDKASADDSEEADGKDKDKDKESEEYLPGYKTEEEWKERHTGSVSYIWEPTVIVSIFIDEEEDVWTKDEKQKILDICNIGYGFVDEYMEENYDTDVELIYDWTEDPELAYSVRLYEDIPAYVTTEQERYLDDLELGWVSEIPYRELCLKYNTSSIGFLYLVPHEGCSYTSMHFTDDGSKIWNEGCLLYLQDMYSDNLDYETPTVFAHELLHLFGAEDFYASAEVFSKETYDTLAKECEDDIMLRTFIEVDGVYTTFPDEVYGEITPVTAYLLGIGDDNIVKDIPELKRKEAACFPGSVYDRPF